MLPDRTFSLDINTGQPRVVSLRLLADSFRNSLPPSDGMAWIEFGHRSPSPNDWGMVTCVRTLQRDAPMPMLVSIELLISGVGKSPRKVKV